jgi:hypothetical protein
MLYSGRQLGLRARLCAPTTLTSHGDLGGVRYNKFPVLWSEWSPSR